VAKKKKLEDNNGPMEKKKKLRGVGQGGEGPQRSREQKNTRGLTKESQSTFQEDKH